ncbi:hypothetical protein [Abyssalbus ytuae]|uniref:Uncharacterized protein n=1 Tax=Abyssalbus ytuae TaxID=2926907 RepID=A0A9E6ZPM2_9FLAO|nr:hypothetical protein [Abyssalbus ytuae]UOB16443.1 hypothetical protein MQE35_11925 [Abyssalbus ytuae]
MLVNVSYKNKDLYKKIDNEIGKSFSLRERIRMGGIGSPKLFITACSLQIHNLLILDNNLDVCNIELRPRGIIVRFRSLLETYALVIPFYKLSLYKTSAQEYTVYRDSYFVRIAAKTKEIHNFMKKIMDRKNDVSPTYIEDL